jgi:hypothetical protein
MECHGAGFNISLEPSFSVGRLCFMLAYNGVVAISNLRYACSISRRNPQPQRQDLPQSQKQDLTQSQEDLPQPLKQGVFIEGGQMEKFRNENKHD